MTKPLTTSFNSSHCYIFENPTQTCLYFYVQTCVLKPNNLEPHEMSVTQEPVGVGESFFLQWCFQHKNIQEVKFTSQSDKLQKSFYPHIKPHFYAVGGFNNL